jgi:hypothetical protein
LQPETQQRPMTSQFHVHVCARSVQGLLEHSQHLYHSLLVPFLPPLRLCCHRFTHHDGERRRHSGVAQRGQLRVSSPSPPCRARVVTRGRAKGPRLASVSFTGHSWTRPLGAADGVLWPQWPLLRAGGCVWHAPCYYRRGTTSTMCRLPFEGRIYIGIHRARVRCRLCTPPWAMARPFYTPCGYRFHFVNTPVRQNPSGLSSTLDTVLAPSIGRQPVQPPFALLPP